MRKFFFIAGQLLLLLIFASLAWADASLYRGANTIGSVPTLSTQAGSLVSVSDVGRLLGYSSSGSGEEMILTKGSDKIRIIANSAAAWHGLAIVPLYSTPVKQNGKFWIDTLSAVSLFQSSAGSGRNNKLRFIVNKSSGYRQTAMINDATRRDIELGKFEEPKPQPVELPKPQTQTQTQTPAPARPVNPPQVPQAQRVARVPEVPVPEPVQFQAPEARESRTVTPPATPTQPQIETQT